MEQLLFEPFKSGINNGLLTYMYSLLLNANWTSRGGGGGAGKANPFFDVSAGHF